MEDQITASICELNYLIEPKKEILDDLDITHECDKDLVPKKEITNTNLNLDTTVLSQHIDIPIKIEIEQNTCKMEQHAPALCDANYLIGPKKEILDDLDITHDCGDKDLVPKKEITNTSLHLDTTVLSQHIDIPIKIEIEQNTWEMEQQDIALCDANYLIVPKKEILDDLDITHECGDKDLVPKKEITNTNLNLDTTVLNQHIDIPIKIEIEQNTYKMEQQDIALCDANYLIGPKKEILDDLDITHECGDKDLVPKKEITNTNLHLDTTVLDQHIDIPIKIEIEQNTWEMEQQAIALRDANYLIVPKKEILDDLETHECGDKDLVPKKEITNTSLHLDTTVLSKHIDIPIKIEIEQNTCKMEQHAPALCDANYLIVPKKEILDDLDITHECGDKDLVPKKAITNTSLNIDADLDQPMTNIVIPIKTETILSEGIVGLQKAYKSSEETDMRTVHMKTQYVQQEPFQSEASLDISRPVTSSNSTNPHNTGNLEYENVNTSVNQTRTKEKTNFCDHCPYKCVKPSHLKTHMMSHTGEKPYHCNQCNYKSSKSSAIKYHMRTHTGEKPYKCNQCDCKFSMSSALKNHIRTHTGEKPYQCKHCDYKTSTAGALKYHMRTHTGEKPYSCEHCEYKCTNSSHLKAHMRTHTGEKPYRCKQCDYKCSKSSYLKTHMTIHTGYHCLQCDYKTMAISAFKYHIKNHT